jgi:hypothetical protein
MTASSGGQTRSYAYDADGVLATQTTGSSTLSYTQDLASPLSQVLQITDGLTTADYLYGAAGGGEGGTRTWDVEDALAYHMRVLLATEARRSKP